MWFHATRTGPDLPLVRKPPKRYCAYGDPMVMGSLEFPKTDLVGGFFRHPCEKYEFVSWDDDIPNNYMEKKCSKPPISDLSKIIQIAFSATSRVFPVQSCQIQHFPVQPKSATVPSQQRPVQVPTGRIYLLASIANPMRLCFSERMHSARHMPWSYLQKIKHSLNN